MDPGERGDSDLGEDHDTRARKYASNTGLAQTALETYIAD